MRSIKSISRMVAIVLMCTLLMSMMMVPVSAEESLTQGESSTVTIQMNEKFNYLTTSNGNRLNGYSWTYTTDTGLQGPAYCINWLRS